MKNKALARMIVLLERIEASLVVRDPGNSRSAEAYDGLRKSLMQSSKNRRIHVSHLLSLSDSIDRGAEFQLIKDRVSDFLVELGVSKTSDLDRPEFFEITGGQGDFLECILPAVVETLDDGSVSLVRLGEAVRTVTPSAGAVRAPVEAPQAEYASSVGMRIAVGITIAIIGFFFGWVIASIVQDEEASGPSSSDTSSVIIVR